MDPQLAKYLMLGVVFAGAFVLVPIIMGLLKHQQKMAELIHSTTNDASDINARLDRLEQKIDALSAPDHTTALPPVPPGAELEVRSRAQ